MKTSDPKPLVRDGLSKSSDHRKLSVRAETFKTLRQGMFQSVHSEKGTAQLARVRFAKLAAKTGTAQAPPGEPHSWFGGFFPYEDPKIAFLVFIERGKSGGMTAAKLAKRVINTYHELYASATV